MLRRRARGSTVLFRLSNAQLPWAEVTRRLRVDVPTALAAAAPGSARDAVRAPVGVRAELEGLRGLDAIEAPLQSEVETLREQFAALEDTFGRGQAPGDGETCG